MAALSPQLVADSAERHVVIGDEPDRDWVDVWWSVSPRGGDAERRVAERLLARIPHPRAFALAHDDSGRPIASCLGVGGHGLLVVESAATLPGARRRGACRALTAALARWAAERGATAAVLSVEVGNAAGKAVWSRLGFHPRRGWSYVMAPANRLPSTG